MHDAAAGCHPQNVALSQQSFVTVAQFATDDERHDFETAVWMRAAGTLPRREIDAVVRKHDERIVLTKVARVDHVNRGVPVADEARTWRRERDQARDSAVRHD